MTDEIKVGDRFWLEVTVTQENGRTTTCNAGDGKDTIEVFTATLRSAQRLPPEIGVGDEVRTRFTPGVVKAIDGEVAWLRSTISDKSYFSANLSDLTLVKKAEKD